VRAAGRSKAQPRARPKPKFKIKPPKGFDRPNLTEKRQARAAGSGGQSLPLRLMRTF